MKPSRPPLVLYRGPLERSRLALLLEAIAGAWGEPHLLWLLPRPLEARRRRLAEEFLGTQPLSGHRVLDGRLIALPRVRSRLHRARAEILGATGGGPAVAVGFTSLWYAPALAPDPLVWCVNGIPEERLLARSGLHDRLLVRAQWRAARLVRPQLVVTVSQPMAELVGRRCGFERSFAVPCCADLGTFRPPAPRPRRYLTYLGTGAPWQGLDRLGSVWRALHAADPALRFRVVSRDPRTRSLAEGLPAASVELRAAEAFEQVAELLWEAEAGFLIRADDLVNRVAFPTKLAEYLGAGAPVVATDLGWDVSGHVRRHRCGVLAPPGEPAAATARRYLDFRAEARRAGDLDRRCREAAAELDRRRWVGKLTAALLGLGGASARSGTTRVAGG